MGGHEAVPPEIAKTLVGWKKHFNSYTQQGRFNVRAFYYSIYSSHVIQYLNFNILILDCMLISWSNHCFSALFHIRKEENSTSTCTKELKTSHE